MSLPIRTQVFVVEVSASVMPPLHADEVEDVVRRLAFGKERSAGMGALSVDAREASAQAGQELLSWLVKP